MSDTVVDALPYIFANFVAFFRVRLTGGKIKEDNSFVLLYKRPSR
jgi:hypothetical protein